MDKSVATSALPLAGTTVSSALRIVSIKSRRDALRGGGTREHTNINHIRQTLDFLEWVRDL